MAWIESRFHFHDPVALLEISDRRVKEITEKIESEAHNISESPDVLSQWLKELIEWDCPRLKGVIVLGLQFDYGSLSWQVLASHDSFDVRNPGDKTPVIKLDKR